MRPEMTNFFRACLRAGRFGDGTRVLGRLGRISLYRLRRHKRAAPLQPDSGPVAVFRPDLLSEGERVLAEVDRQLARQYRLAGASRRYVQQEEIATLADIEDQHSYHRLYWAVRYARGVEAGHPRALPALHEEITAYLQRFQPGNGLSTASYTVAERIASLAEVFHWLGAAAAPLEPHLESRLREFIQDDARRLYAGVEYELGVHNHLLNDARGLYAASVLLPGSGESARWRELAFDLWDRFFPQLVLADGALAEQSSHYHLLLCRTALEYWLAAGCCGRTIPQEFAPLLCAMLRLADDLLRPDGSLPRFGDNSPDHTVEDLWGLLAAAFAHGLLPVAPAHRLTTMLTRYYCRQAAPLPPPQARPGVRLYPAAGYAFLRSAHGRTEVAAHADPRPEAGVHGDCGLGSFEVWHEGSIIIREPGCFVTPSIPRSYNYRHAPAQNVTCLNGLAPALPREVQLELPRWYWDRRLEWRTNGADGIRFTCDAFGRAHAGSLTRSWSCPEEDTLVFEERIEGSPATRFTSRLLLGGGEWNAPLSYGDGHWSMAAGEVTLQLDLPPGVTPSLHAAWYTPEYGVEIPAPQLEISGVVRLPLRWSMRLIFKA